jgi:hypothetical protein
MTRGSAVSSARYVSVGAVQPPGRVTPANQLSTALSVVSVKVPDICYSLKKLGNWLDLCKTSYPTTSCSREALIRISDSALSAAIVDDFADEDWLLCEHLIEISRENSAPHYSMQGIPFTVEADVPLVIHQKVVSYRDDTSPESLRSHRVGPSERGITKPFTSYWRNEWW